ncbi:MAG: DUF1573 domain-containing protein [Candidatus Hydrogenedentes bacterium]|nr:DUF1573 domain-containing protein [Candidatus Hydrogenedentota bacterium]
MKLKFFRLAGMLSSFVVLLSSPALGAPKAVLGIEKLDFGTVLRGDTAEKTIPIRNDGDAAYTITKVNSSCPCVILEMPPAELAMIAPGATYNLPVRYDSKDRIGPQGAVIAIMTDDPANPALTLDVTAFVESLVVVRPPNGVVWGYVPRGDTINKKLEISPGNSKNDIELIEITVSNPGVRVETEKITRGDERLIVATFTVAPEVPLGILELEVEARVRVAGEEAQIIAPLRGEIIGDVLVTPPAIISPKTAYTLGQRISEITVAPSESGARLPKLLGAMAIGAVKAIIVPTAEGAAVHKIAIHAGDNAGEGPQSGAVYVMTDSADQPVTVIPIYFRMAASVIAEPAILTIKPGETRTVKFSSGLGGPLKITNIGFEQDILTAAVTQSEANDANISASVTVTAQSPANPDRLTSIVVVETDVPGGARVYIPVAVQP